ncbi:MAG: type IV pilin, partial [Thermoplasmata archaeon]
MERKLLKRKAWSNESGVSEIIGNILILMITVVLFTSIMMFVNQLPVPEMTTKADFSAAVTFDDGGTTATLTVTHIGGATMEAADTILLVSIDGVTYDYTLSEDVNFTQDEWSAGVQWIGEFTGTTYSSAITVTIVDGVTHNAVWVSEVSGGMGLTPPNVLQRYVDSNRGTLSVDPVKENDNFTLFVKISDLDGDLSDVWVDNTSLPNGVAELPPTRPSSVSPEGGWFEWDFNGVTDEVSEVDGKVLVIYAEDAAGHTTIVPFKLSIIVLPTDIDFYPADQTPQEGGMPSYIKNINEGQGFAVFGENESSQTANISDRRTTFYRGETVYIRAASMYVNNLEGGNELVLRDARSGVYYTSLVTWEQLSDVDAPFYNYAYGGNVNVYQCVFNTEGMMPGTYLMHGELRCTGVVEYSFLFDETLYIWDLDGPMDYYPAVWVGYDSDFSPLWGYTKTTPFNATGTNYLMYVSVAVQDAEMDAASMGEIRIVDMTGGTQLYGPPGSGEMISTVEYYNDSAYFLTIDLRYSNGDAWKLGTNSYTIQISQFSDDNEGVYAYSLQVFIRAPSSRSDFMVGTNGIYSSLGGSTNFISPEYVYHIENNNFFTMRTLYQQDNAPSTSPLYYQNAMALGDLDNDGDLDLLVGSNMDNSGSYPNLGRILYFENTLNTYGIWQSPATITRPAGDTITTKIKWIDTGDINGDGYTDFAYCTTGHKIWVFNNTYGAQGTLFDITVSGVKDGVRKLAL